ncbi:pilus assembly protein PilP [Moraxellaceae bacterium AER2_44_116]|nr:type 4a pilus biogenesis protein PilO [Moraxellaceae bacterium]TQC97856.1 pilus assembly protein PilP [Moraxellaceae bacterium AER2_44_116]
MNTLNTLDPQNIGSWPLPVKVLVYVIVFILVLVLGYMFDISAMRETYASGEQAQETLLQDFEQKVFKANNLDVYQKQLTDMEVSFGSLLKQLPKDTEVPELLEDVTHTGLGSGLEFDGINLGTEVSKEFYAELPISIKVHGDFHAFGAFVSGVSALPRIVTLHDLKIAPLQNKFADSGAPVLSMEIQAKTYRYNDASSGDAKKSDNKDKKGGA